MDPQGGDFLVESAGKRRKAGGHRGPEDAETARDWTESGARSAPPRRIFDATDLRCAAKTGPMIRYRREGLPGLTFVRPVCGRRHVKQVKQSQKREGIDRWRRWRGLENPSFGSRHRVHRGPRERAAVVKKNAVRNSATADLRRGKTAKAPECRDSSFERGEWRAPVAGRHGRGKKTRE